MDEGAVNMNPLLMRAILKAVERAMQQGQRSAVRSLGRALGQLRITGRVEGIGELQRQFAQLGVNFPKSLIRKASRKGVKAPLSVAKKLAPKDTGELKKGIIAVEEQKWKLRRKLKKAVFQVYFDRDKNEIFQKEISKEGRGSRGGNPSKETGYYPISQEYGYFVSHGVKREGEHFIMDAIKQTEREAQEIVVKSLLKDIEKIANRR